MPAEPHGARNAMVSKAYLLPTCYFTPETVLQAMITPPTCEPLRWLRFPRFRGADILDSHQANAIVVLPLSSCNKNLVYTLICTPSLIDDSLNTLDHKGEYL